MGSPLSVPSPHFTSFRCGLSTTIGANLTASGRIQKPFENNL